MPYSACAASSSPLNSLSRTEAQDDSLVGIILMPCFSSKPFTAAMTTEAQSVSGMKPTLSVFFSGASGPAMFLSRIVSARMDICASPMAAIRPMPNHENRKDATATGRVSNSLISPSIVKKKVSHPGCQMATWMDTIVLNQPALARSTSGLSQCSCQGLVI